MPNSTRTFKFAFKIVATACLSSLLVGCSDPGEPGDATVNLAVPSQITGQVSARAASVEDKSASQQNTVSATSLTLYHLILNVTATDIAQPIYYAWDANTGSGSLQTPPTSFSLDVPGGYNRLVQVLAVYTDTSSSSGGTYFYYGDAAQDITTSSVNLNIQLAQLGTSGTTLVSGAIAGRHLTAAGAGPTSPVAIKLQPPGGKPKMLIQVGQMYNGWFSLLGLRDTTFSYELADGTVLFGGPVSLSSFTPSNRIMTISAPAAWRANWSSGSISSWSVQNPTLVVLGYFGLGSAGKSVCSPSSYTATNPYSFTNWAINISTTPLYFQFPSSAANGVSATGGVSACPTAGTSYSDYLLFDPTLMNNNGSDGATGLSGPFAYTKGNLITTASTATQTTLSWTYLPGAQSVIDGVNIYLLSQSDQTYFDSNHSLSCTKLSATTPLATSTGTTATVNVTNSTNPNSYFAICPYQGSTIYSNAIQAYMNSPAAGTVTPSLSSPASLILGKAAAPYNGMAYGATGCSQFTVGLYDGYGIPTTYSSDLSFSISDSNTGTTAMVYPSATACSVSSNPVSASNLSLSQWPTFYYQTSLSAGVITLGLSLNSAGIALNTPSLLLRVSGQSISLTSPLVFTVGTCVPVTMTNLYSFGSPSNVSGTPTVTLSGPSQMTFYAQASDCAASANATTSLPFTASMTTTTFYAQVSGASSASPNIITATMSNSGMTETGSMNFSISH